MIEFENNLKTSLLKSYITNLTLSDNKAYGLGPAMKLYYNLSEVFENKPIDQLAEFNNNTLISSNTSTS